jgi:hypothetical protein
MDTLAMNNDCRPVSSHLSMKFPNPLASDLDLQITATALQSSSQTKLKQPPIRLQIPQSEPGTMENDLPILIIGAGISGLLLAQQLRQLNLPFQVFERDDNFSTRGSGWGLTLHWSLPALRELLSEDLLSRLPDTYVDRAAVARGECSTFPFFDLTTGEMKSASPRAGENERIRVTRERLRRLLATGICIQVC